MSEAIKHTPKLWEKAVDDGKYFLIWCAACKCGHGIHSPRWAFNGDVNSPTFTPSIVLTAPPTPYRCHFNVTAGKIVYHGDCNHDLKGQTVEMSDIPENYGFN